MAKTPIVEDGAPIRITDKRQKLRDAAAAPPEVEEHEVSEESLLVVNRLERIHELQELGHARDLEDVEKEELLRLQGEEEAARQEDLANQGIDVRTAFMVIVMHDGSVYGTNDTEQLIAIDAPATVDDMYAAAALILRDIEASTAARHTMGHMREQARAAQAAAGVSQRLTTPPPGRRR